jgi:hypothetical protein
MPLGLLGLGALFIWTSCLEKEKDTPALGSSALLPAWDSNQYRPQALKDYGTQSEDPVFGIFSKIERAESLSQALHTTPRVNAIDSLRWHHLVDTSFRWPPHPKFFRPYAYDGQYRMDTLFRKSYGLGLFVQEHPCVETWLLSQPFNHPTFWLKPGMRQEEILKSIGTPQTLTPHLISYYGKDSLDPVTAETEERYYGIKFFFQSDSLFAAMLQRSKGCF